MSATNDLEQAPPRPGWPLRALNAVGSAFGGRMPALDAKRLWADAQRAATGGDGEIAFPEAREALEVLIDCANTAPLTTVGRLAVRTDRQLALEHLLRVRADADAHPDDAAPALPPVVIASLPRTGTTVLHRLLALHADARWPRMWELVRPFPAPTDLSDDPRIALAVRDARQAERAMPGLSKIHALDPVGPDECHYLLSQTSCTAAFDAQLGSAAYMRWYLAQDLRWTYAHHQQCLKMLQRHVGGAFWLLKTPLHLFGLDALRETYPDARLIVTHRAPSEVAGSCCSLYEHTQAMFVRGADPVAIGAQWLDTWGTAIDRAVEAVARWPADRVVHVPYAAVLADPVAEVDRIVTALGLPADPGLADRVAQWTAAEANRKDRHGAHRYTVERYGLTAGRVDERFAAWHHG